MPIPFLNLSVQPSSDEHGKIERILRHLGLECKDCVKSEGICLRIGISTRLRACRAGGNPIDKYPALQYLICVEMDILSDLFGRVPDVALKASSYPFLKHPTIK